MCDPRYRVLEVGSHSRTWVNVTPGTESVRWSHCGHVTKSAKFGEGALLGDSDV